MPVVDKFNVDGVDYTIQTTIDPVPTQDSQNAVASGGVYDEIARIDADVTELDNTSATKDELAALKTLMVKGTTTFLPVADLSGVLINCIAVIRTPSNTIGWGAMRLLAGGWGKLEMTGLHTEGGTVTGTVAEGYGIYYSTDGIKWEKSSALSDKAIRYFVPFAINADNDYCTCLAVIVKEIGTSGPCVYKTFDGGVTWQAVTGIDANVNRFNIIRQSSQLTLFASGNRFLIGVGYTSSSTLYYISTDDGDTWQPFTFPSFEGITSSFTIQRVGNYDETVIVTGNAGGSTPYVMYTCTVAYNEQDVDGRLSNISNWTPVTMFNDYEYVSFSACEVYDTDGYSGNKLYVIYRRVVDGANIYDLWLGETKVLSLGSNNISPLMQVMVLGNGEYLFLQNRSYTYRLWHTKDNGATFETAPVHRDAYTSVNSTYTPRGPAMIYVQERLLVSKSVSSDLKNFSIVGGNHADELRFAAAPDFILAVGLNTEGYNSLSTKIDKMTTTCGAFICPLRTAERQL